MVLEYEHPLKKLPEEFGPHTKVGRGSLVTARATHGWTGVPMAPVSP